MKEAPFSEHLTAMRPAPYLEPHLSGYIRHPQSILYSFSLLFSCPNVCFFIHLSIHPPIH